MRAADVLKAHGLTTQDEADALLVRLAVGAKVCAWCHQETEPGDPSKLVSHGICPDCKAKLEREVA